MPGSWYSPQYPGGTSPVDPSNIVTPSTPTPWFRDPMDAARSAFYNRTPDAQYPSGYLDDAQSRRSRLDQAQKPSRSLPEDGVHKVTALGPDDYAWAEEFNLFSGINNQMHGGNKFVSIGIINQAGFASERPGLTDDQVGELRRLAPRWGSGGPGIGSAMPLNAL